MYIGRDVVGPERPLGKRAGSLEKADIKTKHSLVVDDENRSTLPPLGCHSAGLNNRLDLQK